MNFIKALSLSNYMSENLILLSVFVNYLNLHVLKTELTGKANSSFLLFSHTFLNPVFLFIIHLLRLVSN